MNIETLATLKHINVRKEGSDEKILAIDVRFNCQIPSDVLISSTRRCARCSGRTTASRDSTG